VFTPWLWATLRTGSEYFLRLSKPARWIALFVVAILIGGPVIGPLVLPWSGINGRYEQINIKTGQARFSRRLWFVTYARRIEDTTLSRVLQGRTIEVNDIPAWHRVNTFSPGTRVSPHYRFHSALAQAQRFERLIVTFSLTPQHQRELAEQILVVWQETGDDNGADDLLDQLYIQ